MTQEEVAEKVVLSRPAISLVENGKRELNGLELAAFAELYGVSERQVLGLSSPDATASLQLRGEALLEDRGVEDLIAWLRRTVARYAKLESLMGVNGHLKIPRFGHEDSPLLLSSPDLLGR